MNIENDFNNYFIFNDEKIINSYGFKIQTLGIDLNRFQLNPVMLNQHEKTIKSVIGKWINVQKSNGLLIGKPIFDIEDKEANEIKGKVERGFIKGASMGISFDKSDLIFSEGVLTLSKCELLEVSIVAIPSNESAIKLKLYDKSGILFNENEIKNLNFSLNNQTSNPKGEVKNAVKNFTISDIELMINDFSVDMIFDFKTNQKDFKALTVQKVFGMLEKRKINSNIAKTKDFWDRIQLNMELFRARVTNEIDKVLKADFNNDQRINYFFDFVEKNTNN